MSLPTSFFGSKIQNSKSYENEGNENVEKHEYNIRIAHNWTFLTMNTLRPQKIIAADDPDITTVQLILSIPIRNGETTILPKAIWPISLAISDKALSCEFASSINQLYQMVDGTEVRRVHPEGHPEGTKCIGYKGTLIMLI